MTLKRSEGDEAKRDSPIALVGGIVAGALVVAVLIANADDPGPRPVAAPESISAAAPQRGVACPYLQDAFEQFEAGNVTEFRDAVEAAARVGEKTLELPGQVFGIPEREAVDLRFSLSEGRGMTRAGIDKALARARKSCTALARWPSPG